jgi:hypothetical protein
MIRRLFVWIVRSDPLPACLLCAVLCCCWPVWTTRRFERLTSTSTRTEDTFINKSIKQAKVLDRFFQNKGYSLGCPTSQKVKPEKSEQSEPSS